MNKLTGYIILLIVLTAALAAASIYLPKQAFAVLIIIVASVSLIRTLISIRKKAAKTNAGTMPLLQKVSSTIIYAAALGVIVALLLIVLHCRGIGHPLLNGSLALFIAGIVVGMFAPVRRVSGDFPPGKKQQALVIRTGIYLCVICSTAGMLLSVNHYRAVGKPLMYGGVIAIAVFLVVLTVFNKFGKK